MKGHLGNAERVVVFGATSAIAEAMLRRLAARGARLVLVARHPARLAALAADLRVRHGDAAVVATVQADLDHLDAHAQLVATARTALGGIDLALMAHGSLPEQTACDADIALGLAQLHTNGVSAVSLCGHLAQALAAQQHGCLAVVSSVAGDRGRRSNPVYASAKGLVSRYLQGLRARLWPVGVRVVDLRPGFVVTPMTAGMDRRGWLWASADEVAVLALRAIDQGRDVAYLPGFWRWIMLVIRLIPERWFKRLPL